MSEVKAILTIRETEDGSISYDTEYFPKGFQGEAPQSWKFLIAVEELLLKTQETPQEEA